MREEIERLRRSKNPDDRRRGLALIEEDLRERTDDVDAWFAKACCHDFLGEERAAEPAYARVFAIGWSRLAVADQRSLFVNYGSTLRNNGDLDAALSVLGEGLRHFPDYAPIQVFRALTLLSARRDAEAARALLSAMPLVAVHGLDGYEGALVTYTKEI